MAQLRQDYAEFEKMGAVILTLGPDSHNAFKRFWQQENMPYVGLSDIGSKTADVFYQEVNLWKLGRMPAVLVIDRAGKIRYSHYGNSMSDIPANKDVIRILEELHLEK